MPTHSHPEITNQVSASPPVHRLNQNPGSAHQRRSPLHVPSKLIANYTGVLTVGIRTKNLHRLLKRMGMGLSIREHRLHMSHCPYSFSNVGNTISKCWD